MSGSEAFARRVTRHPTRSMARRMALALWRQSRHTPRGSMETRLDGQVALVTGGGRGIGLETSRGLAARGCEVVMASRDASAGRAQAETLRRQHGPPAHFCGLDLADLTDAPRSLDRLERLLAGRRLGLLIANAGLWPTRHGLSAQGHEIAFATNVLGHQALIQGALERGLVEDDARIVIVTGDIYILARACTSDYAYRGALGGQLAYCRSKLGNLWQGRELARRHPNLRVLVVHPGVVASELGGIQGRAVAAIKRSLMISLEQGAQTSLFCATEPGLASGSYYHNVLGRVELHPDDPGANPDAARALWDHLDALMDAA